MGCRGVQGVALVCAAIELAPSAECQNACVSSDGCRANVSVVLTGSSCNGSKTFSGTLGWKPWQHPNRGTADCPA